jgi:hypothetical protein
VERPPLGGVREVLLGQDLQAQRDRRVRAQEPHLAEIHPIGEADHATGMGPVQEQKREADARERDEQDGREDEDR